MACNLTKKAAEGFERTQEAKDLKKKDIKAYNEAKKEFIHEFIGRVEMRDGMLQRKTTKVLGPDKDLMIDPISTGMTRANDLVSGLISSRVLPTTVKTGSPLVRQVDDWAADSIPLYTDTKNILVDNWEGNEAIQYMKTYIDPTLTGIYEKWNKLAAIDKNAKEDHIKRIDEMSKVLDDKLMRAYTEEEIGKLDDIIAKSGVYALSNYKGLLGKLVNGEITLEDAIKETEADLGNSKRISRQAKDLSNIYLGKARISDDIPMSNNSMLNTLAGDYKKVDALTSLYALQQIEGSIEMLQGLYTKEPGLYNELVGYAVQTKQLTDKILAYNDDASVFKSRGNLIPDIPSINYEIRSVDKAALESFRYSAENAKWKVLREPTETSVGIVYRASTDSLQDGIGVNVSYIKNGIALSNTLSDKTRSSFEKNDKLLVQNGNVTTTYLTAEEKKTLGYVNNPVRSLIKAWAHKNLIMETQVVRDTFLEQLTGNYDEKSAKVVNNEVEKAIEENKYPVFLSAKDLKNGNLSDRVLQKYRVVDERLLSDVGGFKGKVQYIRKDLAANIEGYREGGIFKDHQWNEVFKGFRDVMAWIKTNMIIVNVPKIAADVTSGMTLAMMRGASIQELMKYSKEAIKLSQEMTELRNDRILLKTKHMLAEGSEKERIRKLVEENEKEIENHDFSGALVNGFINSLSTEMLAKERESSEGLQVRMDSVLDKLLKEKGSQEYTKFNKLVNKWANSGMNIETIYMYIADKAEDTAFKGMGNLLKEVSKDMERARTQEDMKSYIGQFLLTPNSHFVRLGSAATLYADLVPRWVLYRHYINRGIPENEAATMALGDTLDYKMNMPPAMKFLSDLYFMPFPSFYTRIQRVILNSAQKDPVSFASTVIFNELSGIQGVNILQSNIFSKWEKDSIFTNTFDAATPGNLIPFSNLFYF